MSVTVSACVIISLSFRVESVAINHEIPFLFFLSYLDSFIFTFFAPLRQMSFDVLKLNPKTSLYGAYSEHGAPQGMVKKRRYKFGRFSHLMKNDRHI